MNLKTLKLTFICFVVLTINSFGQNMYIGDTSAETETDTLTRGNYSSELIPYYWDDTTAFDGKKSIRVDWDRKKRYLRDDAAAAWVDSSISMNTPVLKIGESYTFSFYAKASDDNYPISLKLKPSAGWNFYIPGGNYYKKFNLSRNWKRYSFTFVAKMKTKAFIKGYSAILDFRNSPVGKVWYDAIQIEKGKVLSPYKSSSPAKVGVVLNSSHWSNIYFPKQAVSATINVISAQGNANLQCRVLDYKGKVVKELKQNVNKTSEIKLSINNKLFGWFKVEAKLFLHGKLISYHSVNYIKIKRPVSVSPTIEAFAGVINDYGFDCFDISKKIGVKRVQTRFQWSWIEKTPGKYNWASIEQMLKRGKKFGMLNKVLVHPFFSPKWHFTKDELEKSRKMGSHLVLAADKHKYWRKFIAELTHRYGDLIDEVELGAEDNGQLGINEYYKSLYPQEVKRGALGAFLVGGKPFDDLCAMERSGAEEIRKTHPNMKIGAIRPSQGRAGDDWLFVKSMFKQIGKDFNIFPLDPYLTVPYYYGPGINNQSRVGSLDGRFITYANAKRITKELGCNQSIYISESGMAIDVRYPDTSIYRQEQAEMVAKDYVTSRCAGFYAYDWFLGFLGYSVGNYNFSMQQNMKIQSVAAAYSAVAQVVENVTKSKWLAPDKVTRIAIMRKNDGKGIAAIWADTGYLLQLPAEINSQIKITDLMGNAINLSNAKISLSTAPIYIWHDNFKQLCNIIAKSEVEITNFCYINFRRVSEKIGRLQFVNFSNSKDIEIKAAISINGKTVNRTIDVIGGSSNTCDFPLSGKNIQVKAHLNGKNINIEKSFNLNALIPIASTTDGESLIATVAVRDDIFPPSDPWVAWSGPEDLSAQITSSWDAKNLYINCKVKDDMHFNKFPKAPWRADSLQVAIDPKNNGAFHVTVPGKKLGSDDFEFGLALGDDGKTSCINAFGKNICQSNYTISRDKKAKITIYKISLPWNSLGVAPKKGMIFGMSFVIFDDDTGEGQNYYAPIGSGIAGVKNPKLYNKYLLK